MLRSRVTVTPIGPHLSISFPLARQKGPVHRIGAERRRMFFEHRRRVGDRIEADAHELDVPQRRLYLELVLNRHEVPVHERTERGYRAARVDERHDQRGGSERREVACLSVLIDELGVRH